MKVATIVGTRPELIKLSQVIMKLDKYTDHTLIHTGQNFDYELNEIFFEDLNIRKPDYFMNAASSSYAETIGKILESTYKLFNQINPDALLIYGDTNSCLSAIIAKRMHIPIFHMEAGNRCFDFRVPEELNRRIVDHVSDVNLTISEHARDYLIKEGLPPDQVIKIGSSMNEVLEKQKLEIDKSQILANLVLEKNEYFVVSLHREENVDKRENLEIIIETLIEIGKIYQKKIIFSLHPRTKKKIEGLPKGIYSKLKSSGIVFLPPLGFNDYVKLQIHSFCVISDSGTISEESSLLGFPAITVRESHERPEAMDKGVLIMTGLNKKNIIKSIEVVINETTNIQVPDYNELNISERVIKIIYSYTDYIKRNVWKEF